MKSYTVQIYIIEGSRDLMETVWTFRSPPARSPRAALYKVWKNIKGMKFK